MRAMILALWICSVAGSIASEVHVPASVHDAEARSCLEALATNGLSIRFLGSITNLPAPVRERLAGVADKGEFFYDGCIGGNPGQRFVTATRAGRTYNIAIEQGGLVTRFYVMQFLVDRAGKVIRETKFDRVQPVHGSQPIRPVTNSIPAAAGSGR